MLFHFRNIRRAWSRKLQGFIWHIWIFAFTVSLPLRCLHVAQMWMAEYKALLRREDLRRFALPTVPQNRRKLLALSPCNNEEQWERSLSPGYRNNPCLWLSSRYSRENVPHVANIPWAEIWASCGVNCANIIGKKNLGERICYEQRLIRSPIR